jgi:hypothetical protein
MSESCGVCIDSAYDGDCAKFSDTRYVKARKPHKCCECGGTIVVGTVHQCVVGKWETSIDTYRTCPICDEIRGAFCCNGWTYGSLWEDVNEQLLPYMTTACLNELKTAEAKRVLLDAWNDWKFN